MHDLETSFEVKKLGLSDEEKVEIVSCGELEFKRQRGPEVGR